MTIKLQADWLIAAVGADTGLSVLKGAPAWDRPATSASAFVEFRQSAPLEPTRVGQTVTRYTTQWAVGVVAANEVSLWALVDSVEAMIQTRTEATISGERVRVSWGAVTRFEPSEDTIEALRYAAIVTCNITR